MPKTKLGKWSTGLAGVFIVMMLIFYGIVALGQTGGETFFDNIALAIPITLAGISAIAGLITGLIAVIKQRERSVLVCVAILIGALVTLFAGGEILFPH